MAISEEEQAEIAKLRLEQDRIRMVAFSDFRSLLRAKPEDLKHMGWEGRPIGDVLVHRFQHYDKLLDKLVAAHLKKYPDHK